jgi:hypothetical protein
MYNDISLLENHHAATTHVPLGLLPPEPVPCQCQARTHVAALYPEYPLCRLRYRILEKPATNILSNVSNEKRCHAAKSAETLSRQP